MERSELKEIWGTRFPEKEEQVWYVKILRPKQAGCVSGKGEMPVLPDILNEEDPGMSQLSAANYNNTVDLLDLSSFFNFQIP